MKSNIWTIIIAVAITALLTFLAVRFLWPADRDDLTRRVQALQDSLAASSAFRASLEAEIDSLNQRFEDLNSLNDSLQQLIADVDATIDNQTQAINELPLTVYTGTDDSLHRELNRLLRIALATDSTIFR